MTQSFTEHLQAGLYLKGVLASLPTLIEWDHKAAELVKDWRFALRFRILGSWQEQLNFSNQKATTGKEGKEGPLISLGFLNSRQLTRLFRQEKLGLPLVWPWPPNLVKLCRFAQLMERVKALTDPRELSRLAEEDIELAVRMLLEISLRGSTILTAEDATARKTFPRDRKAIMELGVRSMNLHRFLLWNGQSLVLLEKRPVVRPNVRIVFRDAKVALAALCDQLDPQAAVGLGWIEMEGYYPLADSLNIVLSRLGTLLRP